MSTENLSPAAEDFKQIEEDLAQHLRRHPDFFERYPQLLAELIIPHPTSGKTVSLLERQLQVIREQQESTTKKLNQLVNNARSNEKLQDAMENCTLFLLRQQSRQKLLDQLPEKLKQFFQLEHVSLINGEEGGDAFCTSKPDSELLARLFPSQHKSIQSIAVIPLPDSNAERQGLTVAFGAENPKRYHEDTGTKYLKFLQQLLDATLQRLDQDERTSSSGT